jgi:hypothetical protein
MFESDLIRYALCVDAEVESAADQSTTTENGRENWRSWFGKGIAHVAADGTDDQDAGELDADDLDAEGIDSEGIDSDSVAAATELQEARLVRPRLLNLPWSAQKGVSFPLTSRSLIHPHLRADPRWRVWVTRAVVGLLIFIAVSMWKDWRFGLTAAVIYACADTIYRSKTTSITPPAVRVTAAQRATARRLRVLRTAGYMAMHARTIPCTETIIDHVVVGPAGIFTVDAQRMDKRLPIKVKGGVLYHGPVSQDEKIEHARFEAQQAARLIANELGQRVRVRPAMVIYGPPVSWIVMRVKGVDIFDGRHVSSYFRKQSKLSSQHHLDNAQVALVFAAAAHALPALSLDAEEE